MSLLRPQPPPGKISQCSWKISPSQPFRSSRELDKRQGRAARNGLQFKVNSNRILLEFYRDSTGQGDTCRPIRRGISPYIGVPHRYP